LKYALHRLFCLSFSDVSLKIRINKLIHHLDPVSYEIIRDSDFARAKDSPLSQVIDLEMHPQEEVRAISGLFEGEVSLYEKETDKDLERFLRIKRMSNQKYLEDELLLKQGDLQRMG